MACEYWKITRNRRTYFRTSSYRPEEQLLSQTIAFAASVVPHLCVADLGVGGNFRKELPGLCFVIVIQVSC